MGPIRKLIAILGAAFLVFMVWGYFRSNNASFKLRCAAYQGAGAHTLSFPDEMVCLSWYQLKH